MSTRNITPPPQSAHNDLVVQAQQAQSQSASIPSLSKKVDEAAQDSFKSSTTQSTAAKSIQQTHSIKPQSTSWLQRLVARCVLPALAHSEENPNIVTTTKKPNTPAGFSQEVISKMKYKKTEISLPDEMLKPQKTKKSAKLSKIIGQNISQNKSIDTQYKCHTFTIENAPPDSFKIAYVKTGTQITSDFIAKFKADYDSGQHNIMIVELPSFLFETKELKDKIETIEKLENVLKTTNKNIKLTDTENLINLPEPTSSIMQDIAIQTTDNKAILSGKIYQHEYLRPLEQLNKPITPPEKQKWIVYLHPNAGSVDRSGSFLHNVAEKTGANVLSCNYRGVGKSSGFPVSENDLINDGESQVRYLLDQGIQAENIMVFGSSLGGAIATHVVEKLAKEQKNLALCSDRSFSSLACAIHHIGKIFDRIAPFIAKLARSIAASIASSYGWKLESAQKLETLLSTKSTHSSPKTRQIAIIYHPDDQIVHIEASAHKALSHRKDTYTKIELREEMFPSELPKNIPEFLERAHNRQFRENEWDEFVFFTKIALGITLKADSSPQESIVTKQETPSQNDTSALESGNFSK